MDGEGGGGRGKLFTTSLGTYRFKLFEFVNNRDAFEIIRRAIKTYCPPTRCNLVVCLFRWSSVRYRIDPKMDCFIGIQLFLYDSSSLLGNVENSLFYVLLKKLIDRGGKNIPTRTNKNFIATI